MHNSNLIIILIIASIFFISSILLEMAYSKFVLKKEYYSLADTLTSINVGVLSQVIKFSSILQLLIYTYCYQHFKLFELPQNSLLIWVCALVLYDFFYYWTHRLGHEYTIFWAQHVIHHSSEYYNLSTAIRQSSVLGIQNLIIFLPMAFLGINPTMFVIVAVIDLYYQFWVHTECIGKLGYLDKIIVTPTNHAVHHAINPECMNMNYGGVLIIWDRIFGTFAETNNPLKYGTTKPLKSWNPLWANIEIYYMLIRDFIITPSIKEKINVLTSKTGKRSKVARSKYPNPVFNFATQQRYQVELTLSTSLYAILSFIITLAGFYFILTNYSQLDKLTNLLYVVLILVSSITRGYLLNNKINLWQCLMADLIVISSFALNHSAIIGIQLCNVLSLLPLAIGLVILSKNQAINRKNSWLIFGYSLTIIAGLIKCFQYQLQSLNFILFVIAYISYNLHFRQFKLTAIKFNFIPIILLSISYISFISYLSISNSPRTLIIGASILLPIVSCLLITSLNSLSKTKFSWFKLENKLSLAVIGAGLILVHDYLVFIYLHTNINILYSLIILLYGLGQFLLINFAPQGKN